MGLAIEEWERTDGIMQILRDVCLKCTPFNIFYCDSLLFFFVAFQMAQSYSSKTPQSTISCASTRCMPSLRLPLSAVCSTAQLNWNANPFPFLHLPNTLDRARLSFPQGGLGKSHWSYEAASMSMRKARRGSMTGMTSCPSLLSTTTAL